jgi:hypothetical protein
MKLPLIALTTLVGCAPVGQVYSVRRAELELTLPCADTAGCETVSIPDVPFGRSDEVQITITNSGERALTLELSVDHADFMVEPDAANVSAGGQDQFTVTYSPSTGEQQQAVLSIVHNATGPDLQVELIGSTDLDADDDGYRHELAPNGDDCNDFNSGVNPGATEVWYDGLDQDCDGASDYDQDRDGQDIDTRPDGLDCDDEDPSVYSGAPDPLDKAGIDSDCDGEDG